jgi:hypothetical protein
MVSPFYKIPKRARVSKTSDPLDIAARYFVYKLYEATGGRPMERRLLRGMGETLEAVLRSVELGWVTVHAGGKLACPLRRCQLKS